MKLTLGRCIDYLMDRYKYGLAHDYIHKPMSWALYETWKWADHNEKSRVEEADNT